MDLWFIVEIEIQWIFKILFVIIWSLLMPRALTLLLGSSRSFLECHQGETDDATTTPTILPATQIRFAKWTGALPSHKKNSKLLHDQRSRLFIDILGLILLAFNFYVKVHLDPATVHRSDGQSMNGSEMYGSEFYFISLHVHYKNFKIRKILWKVT